MCLCVSFFIYGNKHFVCVSQKIYYTVLMKFHNNCRIPGIPVLLLFLLLLLLFHHTMNASVIRYFDCDFDFNLISSNISTFWWSSMIISNESQFNTLVPIETWQLIQTSYQIRAEIIHAQMHITCLHRQTRHAFHALMFNAYLNVNDLDRAFCFIRCVYFFRAHRTQYVCHVTYWILCVF